MATISVTPLVNKKQSFCPSRMGMCHEPPPFSCLLTDTLDESSLGLLKVLCLDVKLFSPRILKNSTCLSADAFLDTYILLLGLSHRLSIILSGLFSMNCNCLEEKYLFIMYHFPCKGLVIAKMGSNCILFNHPGIPPICTYTQHRVTLGCSGHSITNICHMLWLWNLQRNRRASLTGSTIWMWEIILSRLSALVLVEFKFSMSNPLRIQNNHSLYSELPELASAALGECLSHWVNSHHRFLSVFME